MIWYLDRSEVPDPEHPDPQLLTALVRRAEAANRRYDRLWRYYLGRHDILLRRSRPEEVPVVINYARYVVDTTLGYYLGQGVKYDANTNDAQGRPLNLKPLLDCYERAHIGETDTAIGRMMGIMGDCLERCWDKAVELCVWLCRSYDISPDCIVDHAEAHSAGYASNHADTGDWFPRFGKDMDDFRAAVRAKLNQSAGDFTPYPVRVTADRLNVRSGPGTDYGVRRTVKRGEVYTIVARQDGWGRLKSGAGWVCLAYTMRI